MAAPQFETPKFETPSPEAPLTGLEPKKPPESAKSPEQTKEALKGPAVTPETLTLALNEDPSGEKASGMLDADARGKGGEIVNQDQQKLMNARKFEAKPAIAAA